MIYKICVKISNYVSSDNNITFKKTSFLSGINSEFINQFYSDYLSDPKSLPESWRKFFDGLSEDEKLILNDINGPSWSPGKRVKKINFEKKVINDNSEKSVDLSENSIKQASQDSVRAIMLIRAFRIRGHLISNLDPLSIQEKKEHSELKPETYGFEKDYNRKIFLDGVLGLQYVDLNKILEILKKHTVQQSDTNLCI